MTVSLTRKPKLHVWKVVRIAALLEYLDHLYAHFVLVSQI